MAPPSYSYLFKTEYHRFSVFKWLAITTVIFGGALFVELGAFVALHATVVESALTMVEDVPRAVRVSRDRAVDGGPLPASLEFIIGPHRLSYSGSDPHFEAVVAAVTRAAHRLESRGGPFQRVAGGERIQVWVATSKSTVLGVGRPTLYKLNVGGQPVLTYADTVRSQSNSTFVFLVTGCLLVAVGLRLAIRFFLRTRQDAAWARPLATTDLEHREIFLVDPDAQALLTRDNPRIARESPLRPLVAALVTVGLFAWTASSWRDGGFSVGWHYATLGTLAVASIGLLLIWRHRQGLLPYGKLVMASAECVERVRSVDDDGSELQRVALSYAFATPSGQLVQGFVGGPIVSDEFERWPKRGARITIAIVCFGPDDYRIL